MTESDTFVTESDTFVTESDTFCLELIGIEVIKEISRNISTSTKSPDSLIIGSFRLLKIHEDLIYIMSCDCNAE
ncbi:MAG: hypothetical protein V1773_07910 [bacterium]